MKKLLFGIFAHPDDEAFGPCGTLIKEVENGTELHLVALTCGDAGQNPDNVPDLGKVREEEWRAAGKIIGASQMYNLKLRDGKLNNTTMQLASSSVETSLSDVISSHAIPVEAEIITFEPNGLTGHIDHIVATRLASFVFYRLKERGLPLTRIRYYCDSEERKPLHDISWIYSDKGHASHTIDEIIDAKEYKDRIIQAMHAHTTQRADCERYLQYQGEDLGVDHFIVRS